MSVQTTPPDLWIRLYHPAPEATWRLLCLPHAGGSASYFYPVSAALAGQAEVLSVQYPGRHDRRAEPFVTSITDLADRITAALGDRRDRPLVIFGHSMGAGLAFEITRRLENSGFFPRRLFLSGRSVEGHGHDGVPISDLTDEELLEVLRGLDGTEAALFDDAELRELFLPVVRADYRTIESYRMAPGPVLRTPIHVLTGDRDPYLDAESAAAWRAHTSGDFGLTVFEGGHFYLKHHLQQIVSLLQKD